MNVLVVGFGLICFAVGIASLRRAHAILSVGTKVEAQVVAIEETVIGPTQGGFASKAFHAIYSYTDQAGTEHRIPGSRKSTRKEDFTLGVRKTVVYDPESPAEVVEAGARQYVGGGLYLLGALVLVAVGMSGSLTA